MKSPSAKSRPVVRRIRNPHAGSASSRHHIGTSPTVELERLAQYQRRSEALESTLRNIRAQVEMLKSTLAHTREKQDTLLDLFENTPAPYIMHDASGYILRMNRAAEKLLAAKVQPTSKLTLFPCFSKESLPRWFEHMRSCGTTRKSVATAVELVLQKNQKVKLELLTLPGSELVGGRPSRFYSLLIDWTQRRAVENELVQRQEYYQQLVDMIEGIVWEADPQDLQVTFVSAYAEKLLGFRLADWSRPGFWQNRIFVQDRERVMDALQRELTERKELRIDYRVVASNRQLVWLHDCIRLVEYRGRAKLRGVAIDVSDQRQAEDQLRMAQELLEQRVTERTMELRRTVADLEGFSYSLSHDMRAPIRAMQGYAALVRDMMGDRLGPQPVLFLQRIMQSAERLDLLVRDVLKYSGTARAPLELKPVPLQPLLEGILHEFPSLEAKRASIEVKPPLPCVLAHEAFVGQALSNLLTNAVKFVPKGKSPCVRIWTEPVRKGASGQVEPWVRIWVEDNGLGIAPEDQSRIFRFFERVYPDDQYEGTGMGLAIVQKAVERLGGHVGVESRPGEGSKFWIELRQASNTP